MKKKQTPPQKRYIAQKRYIVKKYIMAKSAHEALKKERKVRPDDVWVDEDWKKENPNQLESAIGFNIETNYEEE
jgi:hypothetical protein